MSPATRRKLGLLLLSVALAFFGCELVLRSWHEAWPFAPEMWVPPHMTERDAVLRWRYYAVGDRNSLGFRNREVEPKVEGTYRILVLGDSMVWWGETSSGPLYTEVLEERLGRVGDSAAEVVNAGVPGYTTYQELELLELYGLDMDPDLVLLAYVINDLHYPYLHRLIENDLMPYEPSTYLEHFETGTLPGRLFAWSHFAHESARWAGWAATRLGGRPGFPPEQATDFYLAWKPYAWERAEVLLAEMQALLSERGVPLLVVTFPVRAQLEERHQRVDPARRLYPQRRLEEICQRLGLPLLDLTEALERAGGAELFRDRLHLTPAGNDIVAAELVAFLKNVTGRPR